MKHYKLVEFFSNFNVKPPLHERKAPPHKCKAPLLTTFWRRFCIKRHSHCVGVAEADTHREQHDFR